MLLPGIDQMMLHEGPWVDVTFFLWLHFRDLFLACPCLAALHYFLFCFWFQLFIAIFFLIGILLARSIVRILQEHVHFKVVGFHSGKFTFILELLVFVLQLHLVDESILESNGFFVIPCPDANGILRSHSKWQVTEEMGEWEREELVTPEIYNSLDNLCFLVVFSVPFIEVFIAHIDKHDFIISESFFITRLWWINNIPELLIQEINDIVHDQSDDRNGNHPVLSIQECETELEIHGQNIDDT